MSKRLHELPTHMQLPEVFITSLHSCQAYAIYNWELFFYAPLLIRSP